MAANRHDHCCPKRRLSGGRLQWIAIGFCAVLLGVASGCQQRPESAADIPIEPGEVTFARDVAPIVFEKCASCHHAGEAAPFSLLGYDDVRRRAGQIVDVTQKGFMPPWLPTKGHGDFVGARSLTDQELQILKRWAAAGALRGDESEAPATPVFVDGWQAGTPDLVLETPAYALAGQGRDEFRNFIVPIHLDAPRWIRSIELRPDNPRVVHHARLGVDSSGESIRRDAEDDAPGYAGMAWGQDPDGQLVIWAPGMVATPDAPGVAWRLYPDTCLVLHTHMQPSGKTEMVKFRIGIHFVDQPPQQHPAMLRIGSCDIDIPAGSARHVVTGQYVLPIDVDLQMVFPHAHSLCSELRLAAERPDGSREALLSIEHFDENWHEAYHYRRPVRLPRGTRLATTFGYDNSEANARNRSRPPRRVVYGSNVTDEMSDVYLQVTAVHADQRAVLMENYKRYELQSQLVGFRKSLELYPTDPWRQEAVAACCMGLGRPDDAITILEERLKTGPLAVFPVVSLGMALSAHGDFARAEVQQRQAIAMDDQYPLAWFGLGKALAAQKKAEPAEQAFRRAVELASSLLEARLSLADLLIARGQLDAAAELCSAAASDSPDMANIYLKLAEIRTKQRRFDESLEYCRLAQRVAPYTHPPKVLLAVSCFQNGDRQRARTLLREARSESPNHPAPALILGQLARSEGQAQAARQYFAAAASQSLPENWPESHTRSFLILLHSERLKLAEQLQDLDLARESLSQWLKIDPENPQLRQFEAQLRAEAAR
ncbi:MAG TPA: tetratricopeptide repeat protein [Pirellulales bacterium]|nr:tetratricopeptide repeat protein [Pirellulales bacterium]